MHNLNLDSAPDRYARNRNLPSGWSATGTALDARLNFGSVMEGHGVFIEDEVQQEIMCLRRQVYGSKNVINPDLERIWRVLSSCGMKVEKIMDLVPSLVVFQTLEYDQYDLADMDTPEPEDQYEHLSVEEGKFNKRKYSHWRRQSRKRIGRPHNKETKDNNPQSSSFDKISYQDYQNYLGQIRNSYAVFLLQFCSEFFEVSRNREGRHKVRCLNEELLFQKFERTRLKIEETEQSLRLIRTRHIKLLHRTDKLMKAEREAKDIYYADSLELSDSIAAKLIEIEEVCAQYELPPLDDSIKRDPEMLKIFLRETIDLLSSIRRGLDSALQRIREELGSRIKELTQSQNKQKPISQILRNREDKSARNISEICATLAKELDSAYLKSHKSMDGISPRSTMNTMRHLLRGGKIHSSDENSLRETTVQDFSPEGPWDDLDAFIAYIRSRIRLSKSGKKHSPSMNRTIRKIETGRGLSMGIDEVIMAIHAHTVLAQYKDLGGSYSVSSTKRRKQRHFREKERDRLLQNAFS